MVSPSVTRSCRKTPFLTAIFERIPEAANSTSQRDRDQLFKMVGPYLGNRPIAGIEAPDLLAVLRRLEKRGVNDTAHRVRAVCGRVFRYAIATGRARRDIIADLKGALAPKGTVSYAAMTDPRGVCGLPRTIDGFGGANSAVGCVVASRANWTLNFPFVVGLQTPSA